MRIDFRLIEVDHVFALRRQWFSHYPCVYEVIIGEDSYVGQAKCMQNRLTPNHPYASRADLIRIHAIYEKDISRADLLNEEARWMEKLKPTLNKVKTRVRPKWWYKK